MPEKEDEKKKRRVEKLYNKALFSIESGQYDYAITLLKSALSIDPNFIKAQEGIKLAKTRELQKSSLSAQKIKSIFFMIQALSCEHFKKYERALDKYESLFALMRPPLQMLPHLGDMYAANGMIENAATAYRAVLQADGNNIYALRKLGKIYLDQGKMAEARPIYDHLSSLAPSDGAVIKEVKDAYALMTIDKGQWQEEVSFRKKVMEETPAEETARRETELVSAESLSEQVRLLRKTLEKEPNNTGARKELAKLLLEGRNVDEAISEYRKIADLDPQDIDTHKTLAALYREKGDVRKAVKEYEKLLSSFPEKLDVLNTLATLYYEQDAPDKAIETYKKITQLTPDDPDAHESLGKLYEHTRYFDKAIQEYEKVVNLAPERIKVEESIGNLYLRGGKTTKAIEKFEKVTGFDKTNTSLRKLLGDLYLRENQLDKAREIFQEILRITADDESAKVKLREIEAVKLDRKIEEIDAQIIEYEKLVSKEPDNAEAKGKLEKAKLERLELCILALEDRAKSEPANLTLHYQLGLAYREKGHTDKALKELQLAVNDEERGMESLHLIGLCFEEKNMLDIAAKQLEKAAGKLPNMNDTRKAILYDLGRVYEKMDEHQKALSKYKEIYEVDISYRDVSRKIEEAYK